MLRTINEISAYESSDPSRAPGTGALNQNAGLIQPPESSASAVPISIRLGPYSSMISTARFGSLDLGCLSRRLTGRSPGQAPIRRAMRSSSTRWHRTTTG